MQQQTAVEWLIDQISIYIFDEKVLPLIEQAKAMETNQSEADYQQGFSDGYNEGYDKGMSDYNKF